VITMIHGDCMEFLRSQPDGAFDLAICDPPYGLGDRLTDGGHKKIQWKNIEHHMKQKDGTTLLVKIILMNYSGYQKIKLSGEVIIFHYLQPEGLFVGIRNR
jgi:DNA modification methylase